MSVPQPARNEGVLEINVLTCDLCNYTLKITANEKHFPLDQKSFVEKIRDCVIDIHCLCWEANNIRVAGSEERYARRIKLEAEAADLCNRLAAYINIAKPLFHLETKRTIYWMEKTLNVRNKIRAWHDSDAKRLKP